MLLHLRRFIKRSLASSRRVPTMWSLLCFPLETQQTPLINPKSKNLPADRTLIPHQVWALGRLLVLASIWCIVKSRGPAAPTEESILEKYFNNHFFSLLSYYQLKRFGFTYIIYDIQTRVQVSHQCDKLSIEKKSRKKVKYV